jgi:hypothetical protein
MHACEAKVDYESQIGSSDHHNKRERERERREEIEIANEMSMQFCKEVYLIEQMTKYIPIVLQVLSTYGNNNNNQNIDFLLQ